MLNIGAKRLCECLNFDVVDFVKERLVSWTWPEGGSAQGVRNLIGPVNSIREQENMICRRSRVRCAEADV